MYIVYAANEIKLDEISKVEYSKAWLFQHRLTLIGEDVLKFKFEAEFFECCKDGLIVVSCAVDDDKLITLSLLVEQSLGCLSRPMHINQLYMILGFFTQ